MDVSHTAEQLTGTFEQISNRSLVPTPGRAPLESAIDGAGVLTSKCCYRLTSLCVQDIAEPFEYGQRRLHRSRPNHHNTRRADQCPAHLSRPGTEEEKIEPLRMLTGAGFQNKQAAKQDLKNLQNIAFGRGSLSTVVPVDGCIQPFWRRAPFRGLNFKPNFLVVTHKASTRGDASHAWRSPPSCHHSISLPCARLIENGHR